MRVLLTTDTVGGVWTYTRELAEGLLDHGHAVALVSFGGSPSPEQLHWSSAVQSRFGNPFRYVPSDLPLEWMPANDLVHSRGTSVLQQVASEFQPDLLHANQFCFGRLELDVPRLVVAHSDVLSWSSACTPAGLPPSPWLDQYVHLVQTGLHAADALVAPTRWMLDALAANFSLPASQHVIANGRSLPHLPEISPRLKQAVTAGRMWDPSKNLAILREIKTCPVLIAGSSSCDDRTANLSSHATQLGFLPEADLLNLFRSSRIYIAASTYEPFGLAPLEAALCGCVLVANDLASFREVWGPAALYFKHADDLEHQLTRLLTDDTLFAHMQTLSLQQARQYSAAAMTSLYIALYTDLLRARPSARTATPAPFAYVN